MLGGGKRRQWTAPALVAGTAALVAVGLGCSGDGGSGRDPDPQAFAETVAARHGASATEAECITDFVFADYADDEIERIADEGITSLSLARWDAYFYSVVACLDPAGDRG